MQIVDLKNPHCEYKLVGDCGLCLGNFDGVHIGHRALIKELRRLNRQKRLPLGALCFQSPPSLVLQGSVTPQLNTKEEKLELLAEAGLDFAILLDFERVKDLSPEDFVKDILIQQCHSRLLVCGFNYSFGKGGKGTPEALAAMFGTQPNRTLSVVPQIMDGIHTVSSSRIRLLLENKHPEDAARLLGRPFFISGSVGHGLQNGRKMGFPTVNIPFPEHGLVPAKGVYASLVQIGKRVYPAISNVGTRPTFQDGDDINCESYIFDFDGDLYGQDIRVSLIRYLRPEKQFASAKDLHLQIQEDIKEAKSFL